MNRVNHAPTYTARETMRFYSWLRQQKYRDDTVGDLARDARHDRCWPRQANTLNRLLAHLVERHNVSDAAIEALERAHQEWGALGARARPLYSTTNSQGSE